MTWQLFKPPTIHTLPYEIASLILIHALGLPYEPSDLLSVSVRYHQRISVLRQVCKKWNSVLLETPQIWRILPPGKLLDLDKIQVYLSRGGHPTRPRTLDIQPENTKIVSLISRYTWDQLGLLDCDIYTLLNVTHNNKTSGFLSRIKHLGIACTRAEHIDLSFVVPTELVTLSLRRFTRLIPFHMAAQRVTQLHLCEWKHITGSTAEQFVAFLSDKHFPALQEVIFDHFDPLDWDYVDYSHIPSNLQNHSMKRLTVIGLESMGLLKHLVFPNLESFRFIRAGGRLGRNPDLNRDIYHCRFLPSFPQFLRPSSSNLKSLYLDDPKLDYSSINIFVRLMCEWNCTSLRNLHIHDWDQLISVMIRNVNTFLPWLETIVIKRYDQPDTSPEYFRGGRLRPIGNYLKHRYRHLDGSGPNFIIVAPLGEPDINYIREHISRFVEDATAIQKSVKFLEIHPDPTSVDELPELRW